MPSATPSTRDHSTSSTASVSPGRLSAAMGGSAAVVSAFLQPSWDETFWLGVARLVQDGRALYEGAIDNKTPPVYLVTWLLDAAPGSFPLMRAIWVGLLVATFTAFAATLVIGTRDRLLVASVAAISVVLATDFVYTTELAAVTFLAGALLAARRDLRWAAVALAVGAAAFDPRVILLYPGIVLMAPRPSTRRQLAIALSALSAAAVIVVVATPPLRYGLVEGNLASRGLRGGLDLAEWAVAGLQTLLPIAGILYLTRRRLRTPAAIAIATGAVVIGASSVHGFPHYWTYLAVVPLVSSDRGETTGRPSRPMLIALVAVSFLPALAETVTIDLAQQRLWDEYRPVIEEVEGVERLVVWDIRPHVGTAVASANLLRSPTVHYLGWDTSRSSRHLVELDRLVESAEVIVDSGGLVGSSEGLVEELRPAKDVIAPHLDAFPCVVEVSTVTIRSRSGCEASP